MTCEAVHDGDAVGLKTSEAEFLLVGLEKPTSSKTTRTWLTVP